MIHPLPALRRKAPLALAALLLGALLLAGAPAARAGVHVHEPSGLRVINTNDWLQALDPKDGRVVWSQRARDAANLSVLPASDQVWLLAGSGRLRAFSPATGKALWNETGLDLAWGPEVAGAAVWTAERGNPGGRRTVTIRSRDIATGRELWAVQQTLDVVAARAWGTDLVLQLRPFPAEAARSKYLRPEDVPAAPGTGQDRLVLLDGVHGGLRWSYAVGADVDAGPWTVGERLLTEERDPAGRYLSARTRENGSTWTLPLAGPLAAAPVAAPGRKDRLRLVVGTGNGARLQFVNLADGKLVWEYAMPGDLAAEPMQEGTRLVLLFLEPDPDAPAGQPRPRTRVTTLEADTGRVLDQPPALPGVPVQAVPFEGRLFLFMRETSSETALDPRGRVIPNLQDGKPALNAIEGYRLYEVREGAARRLAGDPRDALLEHPDLGAPAEVAGKLLLYGTRRVPPQSEGEARAEDARHPEAPQVLHAFDLSSGREAWVWQGADRLEPGWKVVGDTLCVTTADRNGLTGSPVSRVLALDPATGRERWRTPWLKGLASDPEAVPGGLFLLTSTDVAYVLDPASGAIRASLNLVPVFNWVKWNNLAGVLLLTGCIAWFIFHARRRTLFIRRIAGLSAIDEAVGRSTEMGKPVLYVPGLADVDDIQTLASLSILGHVARRTAEYDTPILVPNCRSVVMSMAQEVVREAYTAAGRPESFQRDNVRYLSDEQFGFAAGVSGIMMRERPAANFYMGTFFAEALILAETGNATGAIQIAGTAMASQLPFFVAACDYTLIGEELYAASAWLSRDPMQVGSLKGQDAAKAAIMASILLGALLFTLGFHWIKELWITS